MKLQKYKTIDNDQFDDLNYYEDDYLCKSDIYYSAVITKMLYYIDTNKVSKERCDSIKKLIEDIMEIKEVLYYAQIIEFKVLQLIENDNLESAKELVDEDLTDLDIGYNEEDDALKMLKEKEKYIYGLTVQINERLKDLEFEKWEI